MMFIFVYHLLCRTDVFLFNIKTSQRNDHLLKPECQKYPDDDDDSFLQVSRN